MTAGDVVIRCADCEGEGAPHTDRQCVAVLAERLRATSARLARAEGALLPQKARATQEAVGSTWSNPEHSVQNREPRNELERLAKLVRGFARARPIPWIDVANVLASFWRWAHDRAERTPPALGT